MKVDKDGNVIEESAITAEQYNEVVAQLAAEKQAKANLTGEIQDLRKAKQDAEKRAEEANKTTQPTTVGQTDVVEVAKKAVAEVLGQNAKQQAEANKKMALAKFKEAHKEFHDENDQGGLKFAAFEEKLKRFNTDGVSSVEGYLEIFEDAEALLKKREQTGNDTYQNPYTSTPQTTSSPKTVDGNLLSSTEQKVINQFLGGDKERYLKIKAKRPEYVETLLQYVR